jgi:hypothetical protein
VEGWRGAEAVGREPPSARRGEGATGAEPVAEPVAKEAGAVGAVAVVLGSVAAWWRTESLCESDGGGKAAALEPAPPPPARPNWCSFLTGNCGETPRGSPEPVMARLSFAWLGLGFGFGFKLE